MIKSATIVGRVLLIDDDEDVHAMLRYHLGRAGFELLSAKASQEGLEILQDHPEIVAILVDIYLPRADVGWALLGRLSKLKKTLLAHIPIIVYSVDDDKDRVRAAGADAHILKPANFQDIVTLISKYAEQRSKANDL